MSIDFEKVVERAIKVQGERVLSESPQGPFTLPATDPQTALGSVRRGRASTPGLPAVAAVFLILALAVVRLSAPNLPGATASASSVGAPTSMATAPPSQSAAASLVAAASPTEVGVTPPAPVPSNGVTSCRTKDLEIAAGRDGETGVVHVGVAITNIGAHACWLPGLPESVALLRSDGKALDLVVERPLGDASRTVTLRPNVKGDAALIFYWMNWCLPSPGSLRVEIAFAGSPGVVSGPVEGPLIPRCDNVGQSSALQVDGISANGH